MRSRRFRRPLMGPTFWLLLAVLLVAARLAWWAPPTRPEAVAAGDYRVRYVIDGDTLVLENNARVRLQGIDTPEAARGGRPAEPWSHDATRYTRRFVEQAGGVVRLSFGDERIDHYGRHLAFVWRGERMLNEELVRSGFARARPDYRFSGTMKRRLLAAQDEARESQRGLWSGGGAGRPTD